MDITKWSISNSNWLHSLRLKKVKLYTASKSKSGADCGSDYHLLIEKFRLKPKKVGKTTRQASSYQFIIFVHISSQFHVQWSQIRSLQTAMIGVFLPWKLVNFFLNFIFGCIASSLPHRLFSSCHEPGDTFLLWYMGFSLGGFSCCGAQSLGHMGLSSYSSWAR